MAARLLGVAAAAALMLVALSPARADERGRDRDRDRGWHDQDIHRFHDRDFDRWRGGRWFHGPHEGRLGWWWIVGPSWYFYPRAVYPYPDPYVPPYAASGAPAWYYCPPAQAYYPYVPSCPVPWQVVPAQ
jgi:hypothetical protein